LIDFVVLFSLLKTAVRTRGLSLSYLIVNAWVSTQTLSLYETATHGTT